MRFFCSYFNDEVDSPLERERDIAGRHPDLRPTENVLLFVRWFDSVRGLVPTCRVPRTFEAVGIGTSEYYRANDKAVIPNEVRNL